MTLNLKKVLISDPVNQICAELLQQYGIQVTHGVKLTPDQLIQQIKDYDGLIVRSETKVTAQVLESGAKGKLKLVGRAGTGVDNIDIEAATKYGIYVLNTPGGNSLSACELTCALISAVARNVGIGVSTMKDSRWERKQLMGTELYGKTLAVIGLGRIGSEVAKRMKSYGMTLIGFDPLINQVQAQDMGVQLFTDLNQLWPLADYITLHVPLNRHTKDLINHVTFSKCKRGVKVINVARGGIINEQDLLTALQSGLCGGAGLDVYSEEPPKSQNLWDLIKHPLVTPTPHLGASTAEAQVRVAEEIAQQFVALASSETQFKVMGAVNSDVLSALSEKENSMLINVARSLGTLIASIYPISKGTKLTIQTQSGKESRWVSSCVIEGLTSQTGPMVKEIASSKGLEDIKYSHIPIESQFNQLIVTYTNASTSLSLKGTWSDTQASLLYVGDAEFNPAFPLTCNSSLLLTQNFNHTLQKLFNDGKDVKSIGVANGTAGTWICINS